MLTNSESIRDVIAFPKTQRAQDLMTESPSKVSPEQIQELDLDTLKNKRYKNPNSILLIIFTKKFKVLL